MIHVDVVLADEPSRPARSRRTRVETPETPQPDVAAETKPAKRRRASSTPIKPAQREKE